MRVDRDVPDKSEELLRQFPLYRTEEAAVARDKMRDLFGLELLTPETEDFSSRTNRAELPNLQIYASASSKAVSILLPRSGATHVHFFLRGGCVMTSGEHRVEGNANQAFVCSDGLPVRLDYGADFEEVMLNVRRPVLDRTFASLTGFPPKCAIVFEPLLDTGNPRYSGFRDLVLLLAGRLDPSFSAWPQATLEQLETACVTSLLFCGRHNLSHLLDAQPGAADIPRHLRVAEHFAEVNADRDIGLEEMARASAISASTLNRSFLKYRGCSATAFIKRTRLARARALLESGAATTVAGVALRCGFSNSSRFGKDYRQAFGETPKQTLQRLRVQPGV